MNQVHTAEYNSPLGILIMGSYEGKICLCDWKYRKMRSTIDRRIKRTLKAEWSTKGSDIIQEAIGQLEEYFKGDRKIFDLPLLPLGTDFQRAVWKELLNIPYGITSTYAKQAECLGNTKAIRAVAGANGANAISIIVPCHRIIGARGELVGYAGGLSAKEKLLALEASNSLQKKLFTS
ncbi:methylated-DNA--[protein]-cysteine S-methyltransferase [Oceanispirochaeta crateris]|uniref:Methylated-DNA--protein-cysteine methyltransferase n=1 Tax=Oceanispirochaeta crateris TaxID=2518645 RepID=A0A5C1QJC4_9SPIO|nr:methylated-DNA--[protein]-cysteine S-methyltransferase [Oceanispirochaeta crateris]QEN07100.1 methylated-DNA--[protein]-cysteine S-methyltransferase [Oceanispirochaeta crateris]